MGGLGFYTTATQALQGADLAGKTAVVTGGNSGIGLETVRALALAGAHVVLLSRSVDAGKKIAESIRAEGVLGSISVKRLDLADLSIVQACAEDINSTEARLDLLILNAGVMMTPFLHTAQGLELQIGTNHFGHFLFTQLLLDKVKMTAKEKSSPARVISLSSAAHQFPQKFDLGDIHYRHRKYQKQMAYGYSKLANVLFARELARRLEGTGVSAFSVHPGIIFASNLYRHLPPFRIPAVAWLFSKLFAFFLKSNSSGAATTVYAATAPGLDAQSGAYLYDCKVQKSSKLGQDMDLAARLWTTTEQQLSQVLKDGKLQ
ncbi:hypothetical protein WJX84_005465 [Apatococcus fuscideae]|uniref:Uncharacterized protein n=1 Tax=Apatococcus fuscideae TaxID=2026836 RepID=A0AAW1T5M8_9CHLO